MRGAHEISTSRVPLATLLTMLKMKFFGMICLEVPTTSLSLFVSKVWENVNSEINFQVSYGQQIVIHINAEI